jgi:dihydroorotase
VVAPGFIDVLSYEPNDYGIWFKISDGVTTNLGMHGINSTAEQFFNNYVGRSPCHIGGAFDDPYMRSTFEGLGITQAAQPYQLSQLESQVTTGFEQGWIGLDFEPEYTPGVKTEEMIDLGKIATQQGKPIFFHARYSDPARNLKGIDEVLRVAHATGAGVHVDHITSTGGTYTMPASLAKLAAARKAGVSATACMYPYTFWATTLGAARFGPDPETGQSAVERFRIRYEDMVIVGTGEHLTESSFNSMRNSGQNPLVAVLNSIPESDIEAGLKSDFVMIGSDAILEPGNHNHPRSTGCFSRTLGVYVREKKIISLQQALAKMTILPAKRLEKGAPVMKKKGRLQRGAHADITVFDPATVKDQGTVENPGQASIGVEYVLVLGKIVKDKTGVKKDVIPGKAITPTAV